MLSPSALCFGQSIAWKPMWAKRWPASNSNSNQLYSALSLHNSIQFNDLLFYNGGKYENAKSNGTFFCSDGFLYSAGFHLPGRRRETRSGAVQAMTSPPTSACPAARSSPTRQTYSCTSTGNLSRSESSCKHQSGHQRREIMKNWHISSDCDINAVINLWNNHCQAFH